MGRYFKIIRTDNYRIYTINDTIRLSIKVYDANGNLVSPNNGVKVYFYDSCGNLIKSLWCNETSIGNYEIVTNLTISDNFGIGKYLIRFMAWQSGGKYAHKEDYIVILPEDSNLLSQVRLLSGIDSKKQIDDDELALIIWNAWCRTSKEVFSEIEEVPLSNPTTGSFIDGSNKLFQVSNYPLADISGDWIVKGYGESSCATDIDGYYIDEDGKYHKTKITVISPEIGTIKITQLDDSALPVTTKELKVHYWYQWKTFDIKLFYEAVSYLAAHKCLIRLQTLNSTTMADINSNEKRILMSPNRMLKEYKRIIRLIRKPQIGAV